MELFATAVNYFRKKKLDLDVGQGSDDASEAATGGVR